MKIEATKFDYNYHYSEIRRDGEIRHVITVYNQIIVDGVALNAVYQTGDVLIDYSLPRLDLSLQYSEGHELLGELDRLYEEDFEDDLEDILTLAKETVPSLDSVEKLHKLYLVLMDNLPVLSDFLDQRYFTENIEDYERIDHPDDELYHYKPIGY